MKIKVGDREVDLSRMFPLTIGALEDLESLDINRNEKGEMVLSGTSIRDTRLLLQWALHVADTNVTEKEVRALTPEAISPVVEFISTKMAEREEVNRPLSESSTSSPENTDGASETS